jgi:hypothetical protein
LRKADGFLAEELTAVSRRQCCTRATTDPPACRKTMDFDHTAFSFAAEFFDEQAISLTATV